MSDSKNKSVLKFNNPKPQNLIAKDVRTPKYRMRVVDSEKAFKRSRLKIKDKIEIGYQFNE